MVPEAGKFPPVYENNRKGHDEIGLADLGVSQQRDPKKSCHNVDRYAHQKIWTEDELKDRVEIKRDRLLSRLRGDFEKDLTACQHSGNEKE
jgi:hypothetical protein